MEDRIRSTAWLRSHFFCAGGLEVFPGSKERECPELPSGMSAQDLGGERVTAPAPLSSGSVTLTLLLFDVVDCATLEAAGLPARPPSTSTGWALSLGALGTSTTAS